jgi:hypothetical protein
LLLLVVKSDVASRRVRDFEKGTLSLTSGRIAFESYRRSHIAALLSVFGELRMMRIGICSGEFVEIALGALDHFEKANLGGGGASSSGKFPKAEKSEKGSKGAPAAKKDALSLVYNLPQAQFLLSLFCKDLRVVKFVFDQNFTTGVCFALLLP